jgi:diacylglycerol kinase (ATP)
MRGGGAPSPLVSGLRPRVLVVANPAAGGFHAAALERFAGAVRARGLACEVRLTRASGDLTALAASVNGDVETLVVAGGDGSINEAVQGLLKAREPGPALAILPFGTANVLAHELCLPFRPEKIADAVAMGATKPIHLGRIGERAFMLMTSAGFDADVVHAVDPAVKRRWGKLAYAATALRLAFAHGGRDVTVEADGERFVCRLAVVTTARFYGGPLTITRETDVTRPGLRLVMLRDDRPKALARAALGLAMGRLSRVPGVTDRAVSAVRFSGAGIRMQIDGDRMATVDDWIRAEPRTLNVIAG